MKSASGRSMHWLPAEAGISPDYSRLPPTQSGHLWPERRQFWASRLWNEQVEQALIPLLDDNSFEIQKIAIEAISANASHASTTSPSLKSVIAKIKTGHPAVRRAAALAAATLAKRGTADDRASVADALANNLKADAGADRFLHDGFIRAIERLGQSGFDRLIASAKSDGPDATAIPALEACRSREAADAITKVLELPGITDAQAARLLVAYRYIQVEPAIDPAHLKMARCTSDGAGQNPSRRHRISRLDRRNG